MDIKPSPILVKTVVAPCAKCNQPILAKVLDGYTGKINIKCPPCGYTFSYDYPRPE